MDYCHICHNKKSNKEIMEINCCDDCGELLKAKKQIMSIWRNQLNKDLPTIRHSEDGSVNVVLAVHHPKIYAKNGSNSYIPPWTICNTEYYCKHPDEYLGWIDLEDLQFDKYS